MIPIRQCVGCRDRRPQPELVRFVRRADGWVADAASGRQPGRGAYVCSRECVQRAAKNRRYPGLAAIAVESVFSGSSSYASSEQ